MSETHDFTTISVQQRHARDSITFHVHLHGHSILIFAMFTSLIAVTDLIQNWLSYFQVCQLSQQSGHLTIHPFYMIALVL